MLNFLRKLRHNNMNSKYLTYAIGEIVLVVAGILIALSVSNWNEERKEKKLSQTFIARIDKDLAQLIESSDAIIEQNRGILKAITQTQAFLERGTGLSDSEREIVDYAMLWFPRTTYNLPHMLTYEEMKESGKINLIYDQEMRTALADFYNYLEQIEALYIRLGTDIEVLFQVFNRYLRSTVDPDSLQISFSYDFEAMSKDQEFINTFSRITIHWRGFTWFMERVNQRGDRIVEEYFSE